MPYRQTVFAPGEIYHVFNRGVARQPIFFSRNNYSRFIQLIDYYRFCQTPVSFSLLMNTPVEIRGEMLKSLIKENNLQAEILAFCLMPNHFHFLLKEVSEKGIANFMRYVQNGYAKYLNIKENRVGPLFQSMFKAVRIQSDEQLLHVSRYIHLNPSTEYLVKIEKLSEYSWSSLPVYLDTKHPDFSFVNPEPVLSFFKDNEKYKEFVLDQAEYQRELDKIKHLTLE